MTFLAHARAAKAAAEDAGAEIRDSLEDRITAQLGARPAEVNPVKHYLHAQMVSALNQRAELSDAADDLRRLESERGSHSRTIWILMGLVFTFALESVSGYLVMKGFERPFLERVLLGMGLALFLFAFTAVVSRPAGGAALGGGTPNSTNRALGLLIRLLYVLFVGALAIVRLREGDEELSQLEQISECCIMVACSIGPGFMGHHFMQLYSPLRRLNQELSLRRSDVSRLTKERRRAEHFLEHLSKRQLAYDEEAERLRAIYRTQFRLTAKGEGASRAEGHAQGGHDEEA